MTKEQIRKEMKNKRLNLTALERQQYDSALLASFLSLHEYVDCENLFAYVSFGTEPDTHLLIMKAVQAGKKVFVPCVEGPEMEFYRVSALDGFEISGFGIPEPQPDMTKRYQGKGSRQLMLMPGLAFDQHGGRIGFGAGYFDKYLVKHPPEKFCKVALAYDFQIYECLDTEQHDIGTDIIVTPTKTIYC
jgi:5-formyltetrahydrofolate cyclo-ligase